MSLDDAAVRVGAAARRQRVPGLTVSVVWPDGSTWQRGFGLADVARQRPAGPDTPFLWFSMTKIATATAVMRLYVTGALDLDMPVVEYLPEFSVVRQQGRGGANMPAPEATPRSRRGVWTIEAIRALGATTDVQTAGAILGIGRTKAYEMVRMGSFPVPVLRIGRRIVVPTPTILRLLDA